MACERLRFTVCIPAYNRAQHLAALLDSILGQDYENFEVPICEDASMQRRQIADIVAAYARRYSSKIRYHENPRNLGYDANIRNLVAMARGEFCFFMGNDDLMCPGALVHAAGIVDRYSNVGVVLKSYAWFDSSPEKINQEIRYFGVAHHGRRPRCESTTLSLPLRACAEPASCACRPRYGTDKRIVDGNSG